MKRFYLDWAFPIKTRGSPQFSPEGNRAKTTFWDGGALYADVSYIWHHLLMLINLHSCLITKDGCIIMAKQIPEKPSAGDG